MTIQKRWSALLLAAVLLCSAMTGCSGGEKEDTSTALGIMRKYNKVQPQEIDDNYRSCYEVFVYSFYDSNGDGIGDIPGIISKLDYLADLGIDILWLSPCYQSPLADQGYDISDYYRIDPRFGTMEDMEKLIAEAKKRGICILMDLVVNHCSAEHEWF